MIITLNYKSFVTLIWYQLYIFYLSPISYRLCQIAHMCKYQTFIFLILFTSWLISKKLCFPVAQEIFIMTLFTSINISWYDFMLCFLGVGIAKVNNASPNQLFFEIFSHFVVANTQPFFILEIVTEIVYFFFVADNSCRMRAFYRNQKII